MSAQVDTKLLLAPGGAMVKRSEVSSAVPILGRRALWEKARLDIYMAEGLKGFGLRIISRAHCGPVYCLFSS